MPSSISASILGALLAPFICGTLGEKAGWHWGFAAAGVGILLALAIYFLGWKYLPPDRRQTPRQTGDRTKLHQPELEGDHGSLLLLTIPLTLYWACNEQQGNTMALWSMNNTDLGGEYLRTPAFPD